MKNGRKCVDLGAFIDGDGLVARRVGALNAATSARAGGPVW